MKREHISLLVCPRTRRKLELIHPVFGEDGAIREGVLRESVSGNEYPIVNYIPRFVPLQNYANSFGYQWTKHAYTQQDSYSGFDVSKERFLNETKWGSNLTGEIILEVGSGSGRFTTHALNTGATVVSVDYSNAVEANYKVNGRHAKLLLVQADIYNMPLVESFFDRIFCFGVLQHTPDPERSFMILVTYLKPGGKVATDVYWKAFRRFLHVKTWLRPFTKHRESEQLYRFVQRYVNFMWPLARVMRKTYLGQKLISRFIADRSNLLGNCDDSVLKEWAYLDTFDWLSPAYDNPQTLQTFLAWHKRAGLTDIEVRRGYNGLEGRGRKPG